MVRVRVRHLLKMSAEGWEREGGGGGGNGWGAIARDEALGKHGVMAVVVLATRSLSRG